MMTGARGTVLLTGASGFVGRHVAAGLREAGYAVRAAVRDAGRVPPGSEPFVIGDLAGPVDWASGLGGVDAIVHGAGIAHVGPGVAEARYQAVNTDATLALADAAAGRVRRFVFLSSVRAQSGASATATVRDDDSPAPVDPYGRSKLAAERGLAKRGIDHVSLRPVLVYGRGVAGNMGALVRLARLPLPLPFGGLGARRSLLAVENLADAIVHVLAQPGPLSGAMLVADAAPVSLAEIIAALRAGMGRRPGVIDIDERWIAKLLRLAGRQAVLERLAGSLVVEPGRLTALGWRPLLTTPEGLRRLGAAGG
ncbi:NAD-dependent epimerase/dehydratase family protein [Chelatococcus daeguensis]|uniref:NAD-dependent epimerase/dehydratase family protein n=2 Tax=Chelatococcus TaxID=28209 RepID=UPI003D7C1488